MKRHRALSVGQIIDMAISQTGNGEEYYRQQASYQWAEVAGPQINRYTLRRYVEGTTLHVHLTSAALKNELAFQRDRLVAQINEAVGREVITSIQFH